MAASLAALITVLVVMLWLLPGVAGTLSQLFSGEQAALMPQGFMSYGTRLRRAIDLQTVLSRLSLITRLNLPLCPALDAAAAGERPVVQRVLRKTSDHIRNGLSVSAALEGAFSGFPPQLTAALRRAEASGELARALDQQEQLIGSMIDHQLTATPHTRHAMLYGLIMLLFCGMMVTWVMIVLIPKLKDIFLDFDTALPQITITLLAMWDWLAEYAWILAVLLVVICSGAMLVSILRRTKGAPRGVMRLIAWLRWCFPITRSFDYGLGMAKAIRSLALEMRSGSSMAMADSLPQVVGETNHLRGRLERFSHEVAQGTSPHKSAQSAKLGDVFVCALRMIERGEDPQLALGHAAAYYETLAFRWWHALAALIGPLVTLAMGFIVGFVALALFLPLIALIDAVSGAL
jgi:type II secretory pathway component PulF